MRRVILACVLVSSVALGYAQEGATFEVASVKQNKSGARGGMLNILPGGRVTVTNFSVLQLINFAWQLAGFQVVGGPDWAGADAYDIVAKLDGEYVPVAPGTGKADPLQMAMRNLLADRFKLKTHRDTREMDIYALVLARPGSHGPKLIQSPMDCAAQADAARGRSGPPPPMPARPPSLGQPYCGIFGGPGRLRSGGLNANMIAQALMPMAGRMIVNRTGLEGSWDFELTYAVQGRGGPDAPAADPNAADFFTAVQEQLGLKLESGKGPVEVLMIDSVERPSED